MAKKTNGNKKTRRKATKKVWHIFHFRERYELSEDMRMCRKSALMYTRDYAGANDDEATNFKQQMMMLKTKPNYLLEKNVPSGSRFY